jgi:hypothetical protein
MKSERAAMMLQAVEIYRDAAIKAVGKGDSARAANSRMAAIRCFLSVGVNEGETVRQGIELLSNLGTQKDLTDLLQDLSCVTDLRQGVSGYDLSILIHVAWLLQLDGEIEPLLALALSEKVHSTPFFRVYNRGLCQLSRRDPFQFYEMATRDLERYWKDYLVLISDITNERDVSVSLDAVASNLGRRNADKKIRADGAVIEGSGHEQVKWDFRAASIVSVVRRIYGLDLQTAAKSWSFDWE